MDGQEILISASVQHLSLMRLYAAVYSHWRAREGDQVAKVGVVGTKCAKSVVKELSIAMLCTEILSKCAKMT